MLNVTESKSSLVQGGDVSLFGAFAENDILTLSLRVPRSLGACGVKMYIHPDGVSCPDGKELCFELKWCTLKGDCDEYTTVLNINELCEKSGGNGLYYYCYAVNTFEKTFYLGGEEPRELLPTDEHGDRQLSVYKSGYKTSEHLKSGLIYHIFVDRFYKSGRAVARGDAFINPDWENGIPQYPEYPGAKLKNNMFFGGDLWGIAEKLDYIASFGVRTLYLSPVFESVSNHKYDTGDYTKIDSMFGGNEALENLIEKAGSLGIKIILDGVFNHTGADSVYFNREGTYPGSGAYNSKSSPYFKWYFFRSWPDDYVCWWDIDILPRVNSADPSYTLFIMNNVIKKWMDKGVFGWRLDVADELDNSFLDLLRSTARAVEPDSPVIGEVWEDASNKIAYSDRRRYFQGEQLDGVMNYPLRKALIDYCLTGDYESLRRVSGGLYRRYPKQVSDNLMNFLGSHDTERILTVLSGGTRGERTNAELSTAKMNEEERKEAEKRLKFAFALLCAFPGVPSVFYGDEAGLEGYADPFCRMPYPWSRQSKELLSFYRKVGSIRADEKLFYDGLFENISADENLYILRRFNPETDEEIIIAANRSDKSVEIEFSFSRQELIGSTCGKKHTLKPMSTGYYK